MRKRIQPSPTAAQEAEFERQKARAIEFQRYAEGHAKGLVIRGFVRAVGAKRGGMTRRQALLKFLSDLKWHPHHTLADVAGVRYSARVLELKRMGYQIASKGARGGKAYRLRTKRRGAWKKKLVKVYLEEKDALKLAYGKVTARGRKAIRAALASFQTNKGKL